MECSKKQQKSTSDVTNFAMIFDKLTGILDEDEVQLFGTVARQLWLRRNSVVFGGMLTTHAMVVQ